MYNITTRTECTILPLGTECTILPLELNVQYYH